MRKGSNLWQRMMDQSSHGTESLPCQTIVEVTGSHRVLIENHRGIITYGREKIIVNVKYGSVSVCGCDLEVMHMSNEQLVIFGSIRNISLHRRDGA